MRLDGAVWFQFVSFFNLRGKIMPVGHDTEIVVRIWDQDGYGSKYPLLVRCERIMVRIEIGKGAAI